MFELLALLLPVAAASGWFAATRHYSKPRSPKNNLGSVYFQGLNYLLEERHDKAIDSFIKLLEVDNETVEIHFALGKLFRRQGEVERSIRIHQNLIARPSLSKPQRSNALYELGLDYLKAGLHDRAESLFVELSDDPLFKKQALKQLLTIYQHEKEWIKAIETAKILQKKGKIDLRSSLAHYYCEITLDDLLTGKIVKAKDNLKQARSFDSECARAEIMEADIEFREGRYSSALEKYKKVIKKDRRLIAEVLMQLCACFDRLNMPDDKIEYLEQVSGDCPVPLVNHQMVSLLNKQGKSDAAVDFLLKKIEKTPSLNSFLELLKLTEEKNNFGEIFSSDSFQSIRKLDAETSKYRCHECGFTAQEMHWLCPACQRWDTVRPDSKM